MNCLPSVEAMRADLYDAGQRPPETDRYVVALWCDLFEIAPDTPGYISL